MAKKTAKSANSAVQPKKPDDVNTQRAWQPRKTELSAAESEKLHLYGKDKKIICTTDSRGFENYKNRNPLELRVHAGSGFIPLWDRGVTLRFRFNDLSIQSYFEHPEDAKEEIKLLFGEAVAAWGDACPVTFMYAEERADFEIVMMQNANCNTRGCVLASAFFPDGGRHHLRLYPTLLEQERNEQVETLCHEIGHVFGLRHFFANIREADSPSRLFGSDNEFSIMNYGAKSVLTETDKSDLKKLYRLAWDLELTKIDGAPIQLVQPFSSLTEIARPNSLAARVRESAAGMPSTGPVQIVVGGRKISIE